jgi:5'-deoxynucleotidase YfbR-like HD superfamily hydrolase/nucleoside phosphorylase
MIALREEYNQWISLPEPIRTTVEAGKVVRHSSVPSASDYPARVALALIGEMGNEQSLKVTTQLIDILKPRIVVSLGISALLSDDLKLGDVVVGTDTDNYTFRGKILEENPTAEASFDFSALKFGGRSYPSTHRWATLLENLQYTDAVAWHRWVAASVDDRYASVDPEALERLLTLDLVRDDPMLVSGPIASGPVVVASRQFKDILRQKNRNFVAIDMESAGVVQAAFEHPDAPDTLIIRGISDFGDERKRALDQIGSGVLRAWSMRNAIRLLIAFVAHVDFSGEPRAVPTREIPSRLADLAEHLHNTVKKEYLNHPFTDEHLNFEAHARLFRDLVQLPDHEEADDVFRWLTNKVWSLKQPDAVNVEGDPGTGKTSLLSLLYWRLWREWKRDPERPIPVFVSLHRYNRSERGGRTVVSSDDQAVNDLRADLQPLADLIEQHPATRLLVIVDGYDEYARFRDSLAAALRQIYSPATYRRIVGLRKPGSELDGAHLGALGITVVLRPISTTTPVFRDFLEVFLSTAQGNDPALVDRLLQSIIKLELWEVDLFTLGLLLRRAIQGRPVDSMAALLKAHCREYIENVLPLESNAEEALSRAAHVAFQIKYQQGAPPSDNGELPVFLELVNRHPRISDFLVATHIINDIRRTNEEGERTHQGLGFVYTYSVNRIAKEILQQSDGLQSQLFSPLHRIVQEDELGPYTKAHACYLLGRMTGQQYRYQAKRVLAAFRSIAKERAEVERGTDEERQYLLLVRTIYISLTYLGDGAAQEEYVSELLSRFQWDDINRGFHLEYYGDQTYVRTAPLVSTDNLGPYPKTFDHLNGKLQKRSHPHSYEIDLHTFCSLAQHRHAAGELSESYRERTIEIIDSALDSDLLRTEELRKYVTMVRRHLGFDHFRLGYVFNDFYHVKFVKRKGWILRGLTNGESVADHIYGAYVMAMFLLPDHVPDDSEYTDYSKSQIMQMLLIHDLAEARTGDYAPHERTDEARRKEEEVFGDIAMLGTYSGMAVLRDVAGLWEEYRAGVSINARVARDIDKMENLMQLWVYAAAGANIADFDNWDRELRNKLRTDVGRLVHQRLREFQSNASRELTHDLVVHSETGHQTISQVTDLPIRPR